MRELSIQIEPNTNVISKVNVSGPSLQEEFFKKMHVFRLEYTILQRHLLVLQVFSFRNHVF